MEEAPCRTSCAPLAYPFYAYFNRSGSKEPFRGEGPRSYSVSNLSDTPLLCAMVLASQHDQLGAIPPPPFLSTSPLESMRSGGAIPPLKGSPS